jgi:hypothetical protein
MSRIAHVPRTGPLKLVTWHTDAHDAPYAAIYRVSRSHGQHGRVRSRDHQRGGAGRSGVGRSAHVRQEPALSW